MILHLDMDAFFASVEQMDHPELRGKPVIIGGGDRGVVATASYEARVYGIHSAMPAATARKLCPHGIFLRGNFARYKEISQLVMAALRQFSPIVQAASIDEAYIDAGICARSYPTPYALGMAVKESIRAATGGLTCSVGLAPVKFLAKICSDINKPDGLFILPKAHVREFLTEMPVQKLPGVGRRMAERLAAFGIREAGQLRGLSRDFLAQRFGKWGAALHDRANGIDERVVHANAPPKSESCERTFERDVADRAVLRAALLAHAGRICERLRKNGLAGRTITLKIKFADFRIITRSLTVAGRACEAQPIYEAGCALLANEPLPQPVRLIGLRVSGFDARPQQLRLPGLPPPVAHDWRLTQRIIV